MFNKLWKSTFCSKYTTNIAAQCQYFYISKSNLIMNKFQISENKINLIRNILHKPDGVIAFPTDTVWGIGCLPENNEAVNRIYSLKNRSEIKPLILLGSKIEHLVPYLKEIHPIASKIIKEYFPGAVTLVLTKSEKTPDYITSGYNTVGIRVPDCPLLLEILEKSVEGHVLATTSANISGMKPPVSKQDVIKGLGGKIDYIMDDYGYISGGIESTVLATDDFGGFKILRAGAVNII